MEQVRIYLICTYQQVHTLLNIHEPNDNKIVFSIIYIIVSTGIFK